VDANSIKNYRKWIKMCKKLQLTEARMGDWYFSTAQAPEKPRKLGKSIGKSDNIEGLVHDESAKMPSDSEMLMYSTESFDFMRESRKDNRPR
jgi:hypothetical protein